MKIMKIKFKGIDDLFFIAFALSFRLSNVIIQFSFFYDRSLESTYVKNLRSMERI